MVNSLKYLLLPVTVVLSYFIAYYSILYGAAFVFWMIKLHWAWVVFGFLLMGLLTMLTQFPKLLTQILFDQLFKYRWVAVIPHAIAGVAGIIMSVLYYTHNPTGTLVADSGVYEGLPGLWAYSIPRAIAYVFLILNLVIMAIWTVLYPILMKKNAD